MNLLRWVVVPAAIALALPGFNAFAMPTGPAKYRPLPTVSYQKAERDLPCYMHTDEGFSIDLSLFCTSASTPVVPATTVNVSPSGGSGGGSYSGGSYSGGGVAGGGNSSGRCNTATDLDIRGNPCGKRAADQRSGGR